ncbi:S-methyl-5'-thioadenosine phosphorylase isoform X2 [Meriones unguiculatus]|uniref:S-methyl-5'-thioadenosine phosphorylase isoform X2 n=1 Tax=Meriones unguiculatus TaxID=10047 RepID=UPI00293E2A81|nr:S-methyl-5'-thioadenosine phosphorylase isoform X2 [Meriones unguiculatus]
MAIRKEIQEVAAKQFVAFREEILKSLKEIKETEDCSNKQLKELKEKQENTVRQVKEINKMAQDLKIELEKLKKTQMEEIVERKNLGKKTGTTEVSITNRLQEMEERISGVEGAMEEIDVSVKENVKSKKFLTKTIQEIQDNLKRQNLRIIGIEEKEDSLLQGPENIFNKTIEENFPKLKESPIRIQETYRTPNKLDQKRKSSQHIIIKTISIQNKEKILKAEREKGQVTYNGKPIRITPDFSTETMKARRAWTDNMQALREHRCQPRLLYPAKLSVLRDGENKIFNDKNKFQQYLHTNPALQKTLEGKIQPKKTSYFQENTGNN